MGDQPGAGGSRSYKIRGYTRERQSAKPYSRPPGRKKVSMANAVRYLLKLFRYNRSNLHSRLPL